MKNLQWEQVYADEWDFRNLCCADTRPNLFIYWVLWAPCFPRSSINTCSPHSVSCCKRSRQECWAHFCSHKVLETSDHMSRCQLNFNKFWTCMSYLMIKDKKVSRDCCGISSKLHRCPLYILESSAHSRLISDKDKESLQSHIYSSRSSSHSHQPKVWSKFRD